MGIRKPCVKGEEWNLDGEGKGEGAEQPELLICIEQMSSAQTIEQQRKIKGTCMLVEVENRQEHHQTTDHGVDEELECSVDPFSPSPDADDEIHGDQHRLVEEVEQNQVERDKCPDHSGLQQQQGDVELLDPIIDGFPGAQKDQWHREAGQQYQQDGDPVHSQVVIDSQRFDPAVTLLQLHGAHRVVEVSHHQKGKEQRQATDHQ